MSNPSWNPSQATNWQQNQQNQSHQQARNQTSQNLQYGVQQQFQNQYQQNQLQTQGNAPTWNAQSQGNFPAQPAQASFTPQTNFQKPANGRTQTQESYTGNAGGYQSQQTQNQHTYHQHQFSGGNLNHPAPFQPIAPAHPQQPPTQHYKSPAQNPTFQAPALGEPGPVSERVDNSGAASNFPNQQPTQTPSFQPLVAAPPAQQQQPPPAQENVAFRQNQPGLGNMGHQKSQGNSGNGTGIESTAIMAERSQNSQMQQPVQLQSANSNFAPPSFNTSSQLYSQSNQREANGEASTIEDYEKALKEKEEETQKLKEDLESKHQRVLEEKMKEQQKLEEEKKKAEEDKKSKEKALKKAEKEKKAKEEELEKIKKEAEESKKKADILAQKEALEKQKEEETKFHIVYDHPAPELITAEEEEHLTKFCEKAWSNFKSNKDNQINIKQCWKVENMARSYSSQFYMRFAEQIKAKGYTHHRAVRGDGNCFWRSISYAYLEKLIFLQKPVSIKNLAANVYRKKNPYFDMEDPILLPGVTDKIENMEQMELVNVLCGHLVQLARSLEQSSRSQTLSLLQKMYFQNPKFDKAMIFMFRKIVKNFMLLNQEAQLNGFDFSMLGVAEGLGLEEYLAQYVMKMGEDAQGSLLNVAPVALRINIEIIDLLKQNEGMPKEVEIHQVHKNISTVANLRFSCPNDRLDMHDEMTLYVLRKTGHYDILYREEGFKTGDPRNPCALEDKGIQDKEFLELQDYFQKRGDGAMMGANIYRCPQCQHQCQGNDIKNRQQLEFKHILDPEVYERPSCPSCSNKLSLNELTKIFPDKFLSELQEYIHKREEHEAKLEKAKQKLLKIQRIQEEKKKALEDQESSLMEKKAEEMKQKHDEFNETKSKMIEAFEEEKKQKEVKYTEEKQKMEKDNQEFVQRLQQKIKTTKESLEEQKKISTRWEQDSKVQYAKFVEKNKEAKRLALEFEELKKQSAKNLDNYNKSLIDLKKQHEEKEKKVKTECQDEVQNFKSLLVLTKKKGAQDLTTKSNECKKLQAEKLNSDRIEKELRETIKKLEKQISKLKDEQQQKEVASNLILPVYSQPTYPNQPYQTGMINTPFQGQLGYNQTQNLQKNTLFPSNINSQQNNQNLYQQQIQDLQEQLEASQAEVAQLKQAQIAPPAYTPFQAEYEPLDLSQQKEEAQRILDAFKEATEQIPAQTQAVVQPVKQQTQMDPVFQAAQLTSREIRAQQLKLQLARAAVSGNIGECNRIIAQFVDGQEQKKQQGVGVTVEQLQGLVDQFTSGCGYKQVVDELDQKNQELKQSYQMAQQTQEQKNQLQTQLDSVERQLQSTVQELTQATENYKNSYNYAEQLNKEKRVLEVQISEIRQAKETLEQEKEKNLEQSQSLSSQFEEEKQKISKELKKEKDTIQFLQKQKNNLEKDVRQKQKLLDVQELELQEHEKQKHNLAENLNQQSKNVESLQQEIQSYKDKIEKYEKEVDDLQLKIGEEKSREAFEQQQSSQEIPKQKKQAEEVSVDLEKGYIIEKKKYYRNQQEIMESSGGLNQAQKLSEEQTRVAEEEDHKDERTQKKEQKQEVETISQDYVDLTQEQKEEENKAEKTDKEESPNFENLTEEDLRRGEQDLQNPDTQAKLDQAEQVRKQVSQLPGKKTFLANDPMSPQRILEHQQKQKAKKEIVQIDLVDMGKNQVNLPSEDPKSLLKQEKASQGVGADSFGTVQQKKNTPNMRYDGAE